MKLKMYAKTTSVAQETNRIQEVAQKVGIILPSTHTALFQSVYAPIEVANLNGIRLARQAVETGIQGLIGSQVNLEHFGYGWIVGIILDAWVNDQEEIEIVYSFAKNIYKDEYAMALEALDAGTLSVSFELLAETERQEQLADGTIRLHEVDFQGVGMLITHAPAYPKAKTYEYANLIKARLSENKVVFASQIEENCNKILEAGKWQTTYINSLPNSSFAVIEPSYLKSEVEDKKARHLPFKDMEGKIDLTQYRYALEVVNQIKPISDSITAEELQAKAKQELDKYRDVLKGENNDKSEQGGNSQVTEEQLAKIEEIRAELGDAVKDISDEDLLDDSIVAKIREELAEPKAEEKAEEEAKETEEKAEETEETAEEETEEKAEETEEKAEEVEKSELEVLKEENTELKAKIEELQNTLQAKDSEIEEVRANAEKIGQLKVELKDNEFVADFTDEDYLNEEKVAQAVKAKADAEIVATRKEELKDNEYAKDFSDEDYLNEVKVELAKVKKEKDELQAKIPETKEEVKAEVEEEKAEENLDTGAEVKTDSFKEVMASIRKQKLEDRESSTVVLKKDK